jgi:CheY-like chemotaxis protein/HPt (histidine-containing phosphotransfer) domain-containing protein
MARQIRADRSLAGIRLLLLTSSGVRGSAEAAAAAGIDRYLRKPIRARQLRSMLVDVLGRGTSASVEDEAPATSEASSGDRLLLVEDNAVNQKVALLTLQRLGYEVDVVDNGQAALDALSARSYGAVLMDCQMPVMDGYDATRELRRREGGERHTPVIALTASAMAADRDRCLDAGMDDHLTKPVRADEVASTLRRWVRAAAPESIDRERLAELRRLGPADGSLLAELVEGFLDQAASDVAELGRAARDGDATEVADRVRRLGDAAVNMGATGVASACARLDRALDAGDVDALLSGLEAELGRTAAALRAATS